jgi:predicted dehydrogenase
MTGKHRIGVVGCGAISGRYLKNLKTFPHVEVVACADVDAGRAKARATEFAVRPCGVDELVSSRDVDIVVNLTPPKAHHAVSAASLKAGKHVYSEKPLAVSREEGKELLDLAASRRLLIGCAPDTFLGAGLQTCAKLLTDGWIGKPIAANAFMMRSPPEFSNPDVTFIYEKGAGPLFDMGPYYLTALVVLLGPLRRIAASSQITTPNRFITVAPNAGKRLAVEAPTHLAGVLDFQSGAVGTLVTTFDVWASTLPNIEVYGTEGTLLVPDPNTFGGPVRFTRAGSAEWQSVPLSHRYKEEFRGLGVADMAHALQTGRPSFRARGDLAYHVLEAMHGFLISSETGKYYEMQSTCEKPAPLPISLVEGMVEGYPIF